MWLGPVDASAMADTKKNKDEKRRQKLYKKFRKELEIGRVSDDSNRLLLSARKLAKHVDNYFEMEMTVEEDANPRKRKLYRKLLSESQTGLEVDGIELLKSGKRLRKLVRKYLNLLDDEKKQAAKEPEPEGARKRKEPLADDGIDEKRREMRKRLQTLRHINPHGVGFNDTDREKAGDMLGDAVEEYLAAVDKAATRDLDPVVTALEFLRTTAANIVTICWALQTGSVLYVEREASDAPSTMPGMITKLAAYMRSEHGLEGDRRVDPSERVVCGVRMYGLALRA